MSDKPSARTDRVESAINTLLWQYRKNPVMGGVAASHATQAQELEHVFIAIWVGYMLPEASGAQLDELGKIVGEKRKGRDDDSYRLAIASRVKINKGNGVVESILQALKAAVDIEYHLDEKYPASLALAVGTSLTQAAAESIYETLKRAKGGGIAASMEWSSNLSNALRFAPGDVEVLSPGKGLADTAGTTGGRLAGYLND